MAYLFDGLPVISIRYFGGLTVSFPAPNRTKSLFFVYLNILLIQQIYSELDFHHHVVNNFVLFSNRTNTALSYKLISNVSITDGAHHFNAVSVI